MVRMMANSFELPSSLGAPETGEAAGAGAAGVAERAGQGRRLGDQILRAAFDAIPALVYVKDQESRFVMVNRAMEKPLGIQREELSSLSTREASWITDERKAAVMEVDRKVIEENETVHTEDSAFTPQDDSLHYYDIVKAPFRTPDGSFVGLVGVNLDVTRRRQAEEERRQSEALLRAVVENAPVVLWSVDKGGAITLSEGKELLKRGVKPGELVGKSVFEVYEECPEFLANVRRALAGEAFSAVSETFGATYERWFQPITGADGNVEGLVAISIDITERKQAEEDLRANQRLLKTVFDAIPHAIFVKDTKMRHVMANAALLKLHNVPEDEVLGSTPAEISTIPKEEAGQFMEQDRHVLNTGESIFLKATEITDSQGHKRVRDVAKIPLKDNDGCVMGLVGVTTDITERKQAEQELRASEQKFRSLVEGSLQGIIVHRDFKPLFANDAFARSLGFESSEEILKLDSLLDLIAPHERPQRQKNNQALLSGEVPSIHSTFQGVRKDGSAVWREHAGRVVNWEGGPAILTTTFDVTEWKRAEEELRTSQRLLQTVFDTIPLSLFVKDVEGRYLLGNETFLKNNRIATEDLPNLATQDLPWVTDDQKQSFLKADRTVIESGERVDNPELGISTPRGEIRYFHQIKVPLRDEHNRVTGLVAVSEDITERKRAESELRKNEALLRNLVTNAPVVLYSLDREGTFILSEGKGLEKLGVNPGQNIGRSYFELYAAWPSLVAGVRRALEGEAVTDVAERGDAVFERWLEPLRDAAGQVTGVIAVSVDVSERRQAEADLRRSEELLRNLVTNAPVILFSLDSEGTFILSEGKGLRSVNLQPGELVGQSYFERFADFPSGLVEGVKRALGGEPVADVVDMGFAVFERMLEPVRDPSGQITGLIAVSVDITERIEAEKKLRENQELLQAVFDTVPLWLFVKDLEGRYALVNRQMASDLRIPPLDFVGRFASEVEPFTEETKAEIADQDASVIHSGKQVNLPELEIELPDRKTRFHHVIKVALSDAYNQQRGLV